MSWSEWALIWTASLATTGIIVGLVFLLSWWALPVVILGLFFGLGCLVAHD